MIQQTLSILMISLLHNPVNLQYTILLYAKCMKFAVKYETSYSIIVTQPYIILINLLGSY